MSPAAFTFTQRHDSHAALYARMAYAWLPGGHLVRVDASKTGGSICLGLTAPMCAASMHFTAEQARAVAAELLACADACEAVTMGRA